MDQTNQASKDKKGRDLTFTHNPPPNIRSALTAVPPPFVKKMPPADDDVYILNRVFLTVYDGVVSDVRC